jgi:Bacteriophage HK97-gp10, putative tail-component
MNKRLKLPKAALEFFRKNGRIGGHRRAANLSAEERSEQARKAVQARWAKKAAQASKKKARNEHPTGGHLRASIQP